MNKISAEIILNSREERFHKQKKLIEKYQHPLISFTINKPGLEKNNDIIQKIFLLGIIEIENYIIHSDSKILAKEISLLKISGPEIIYAVDADLISLKHFSVEIENNYPIGRLFDIDIIDSSHQSVSRQSLGYTKRKCLLCNENAKLCARTQNHDIVELENKFYEICYSYCSKIK